MHFHIRKIAHRLPDRIHRRGQCTLRNGRARNGAIPAPGLEVILVGGPADAFKAVDEMQALAGIARDPGSRGAAQE